MGKSVRAKTPRGRLLRHPEIAQLGAPDLLRLLARIMKAIVQKRADQPSFMPLPAGWEEAALESHSVLLAFRAEELAAQIEALAGTNRPRTKNNDQR